MYTNQYPRVSHADAQIPAGWQPPYQGAPPIPQGWSVNPNDWNQGQWQFNPDFNHHHHHQAQQPSQQYILWIPSQSWIGPLENRQQEQRHPHQRPKKPPSAGYLAQPVKANALDLSNMIPRAQVYGEENSDDDTPHTPWIWNPRGLVEKEDDRGTIQAEFRDALGNRFRQSRGPIQARRPSPEYEAPASPSPLRLQRHTGTRQSSQNNATVPAPLRGASELPVTQLSLYRQQSRHSSPERQQPQQQDNRLLQPTFSTNIVRTPDHYSNGSYTQPYSAATQKSNRNISVDPELARLAAKMDRLMTESQKDEAIVDALLEVRREEPGPSHVIDVTTENMAKHVMTALSKSVDQLSDVTARQAQSTLDFLQDLLDVQGLPLSYKHVFLKTSLNLSRVHDCVPQCIMLRGFKKKGDYPFALGQFGEVWRGEVGGAEVAVKKARIFTNDNDINLKEVLRKIRREAIIWGHCDHPNVLPFYGIYRDSAPSTYCLVSPFMVNGSLRQYLSNTTKPDRHRLGLDITRGMDYLHKMSIVHSDLKGDNILITDDHRAVIADFGLSFVMGATTFGTSSSSRKGGTVRWQAPEVLNANPNSLSADVYSLACVYFEVFDGSMPWNDLIDGAVIMNVCYQKKHPPCPRFLSETDLWWELMVQCWAYEPSVRPTLQYLTESLHATDDTLTSVIKWDKSILTRLRDPLVQGKLVVPLGLPSFLNVEGRRI
ncbi:kinase-like domain-containing protein [Armillaria novae-zelandiae]|uniref:Kinase-like domain-containing protein n=1 Tax=Armillaria novae-zelandiae TaxID=153914 RepID=A0AA39T308_9AGAR|nr:kinase-like domain-containing protein [Armillaria novae-zelandiae]